MSTDSAGDALAWLVDRVEWFLEAPPERRDLRESQLRDAYRNHCAAMAAMLVPEMHEDAPSEPRARRRRPHAVKPPRGPACPVCGEGELRAKTGKFGDFTGCNKWPACSFTRRGHAVLKRWRAAQQPPQGK